MQGKDTVRPFAKRMPEASDNGSQPYRNAVRCFEMAGKAIPHTQNLAIGKGHKLLMSPTQGQADIIEATLAPAISQPLWGQLYGWLPLSNAYGIPSLATQYII